MANFTPRLTAPSTTDKNWIHYNHGGYNYCLHIKDGSCLPNCVGYAWGRWRELLGKYHSLSRANAEDWYGKKDGYERGQTPKVGAVICWAKGKAGSSADGAGHVAIVEKVISATEIVTSESGYNSSRFWTKTRKKGSGNWGQGSAYKFQGFIYIPMTFDGTEEGTGAKTVNITVNILRKGAKGEDVKAMQQLLLANGYEMKDATSSYGADGSYGAATEAAVRAFQKAKGIGVDGICGAQTWAKLLGG